MVLVVGVGQSVRAIACPKDPQGSVSPISAKQWATDAARNEVEVVQYGSSYLRYRVHIVSSKGDQIRDVVESRDGTVARLIYRNNGPITAGEDANERQRLQDMLNSPSAFASHIQTDQSGKKTAVTFLKLLPEAMTYTFVAGQPQRPRPPGGTHDQPEIVVDFQPNAAWNPPTMTAEALTGLSGRVWIDAETHYMTRMEANVFRSVNFGWGLFAHIYPGGRLEIEQHRVSERRWMVSHYVEHLTIRALMLKTLKENLEIEPSSFRAVPEMNYRDAINLLLASPLPTGPPDLHPAL